MKPERDNRPLTQDPDAFRHVVTPLERNVGLADATIKAEKKKAEEIENLSLRMKEAMNSLDGACGSFKRATMEWMNVDLPNTLTELRAARMAMGAEFSQLQKQLTDLRKFFIGPVYDQELSRLREFVELCERLQQLKVSGFLDDVADTMLKLAR